MSTRPPSRPIAGAAPGEANSAPLAIVGVLLPLGWTSNTRRRRLLFLGLASPGFFAVFTAPLHRNPLVLLAGFLLFVAAVVFRRRTEPGFARAGAAGAAKPIAFRARGD